MESINKHLSLVWIGAILFGATACLPQSIPPTEPLKTISVATITVATEIVPFSTSTMEETETLTPTAVTPTAIPAKSTPSVPQVPIFGVGMDRVTTSWGLDMMVAAKTTWVRLPGLAWSSVEPVEGTYNWTILSGLESELASASINGFKVVLIVHSTPEWARKIAGPGPTCGPIAEGKLTAFGDFMHALVERYSVAPYNVK
jgi:hypothetical protein